MYPACGPVVELTATGSLSTVRLVGGASFSVYKLWSVLGGASSTAGSAVLARPRLLISIPPVVVVVDNDDDGRDDVTVTSSATFVVFAGFDDVMDSVVPLSMRSSLISTISCRQ